MTTSRALAHRLDAWRSFRSIARAARTLAAAQVLTWASRARQAAHHLAWTQALAEHFEVEPGDEGFPVCLAIGTDLGLCGRMNTAVAEALVAMSSTAKGPLIVVGARLVDELSHVSPDTTPQMTLAAPSSAPAVESASMQIASALERLGPARQVRLSILLVVPSASAGQPRPERWDETRAVPDSPELAHARAAVLAPCLDLIPGELARPSVAALRLRARIAHALCVAAASEASARLFTMSRAYEASDRSIHGQELELRKLQQEAITQDMLEVRAGHRPRARLV